MNTVTTLFGILFCLMAVSARNFGDRTDVEGQQIDNVPREDDIRRAREHGTVGSRHRRRRYQNYGYDYSPPANPFYENRMDYNRNQDLLPVILRQLDDILAQLKYQGQPMAPQPIYVPYPVPYPVPQYCSCSNNAVPNITDRFKMDDENRIWGLEVKPIEEEGDGSRPISFNPIPPTRPISRPPPVVEHGSVQAGEASTIAPVFAPAASQQSSGRIPGMCNAAVVSCCGLNNNQQQRRCFNNFGCNALFSRGSACSKDLISEALDSFKAAYSPV